MSEPVPPLPIEQIQALVAAGFGGLHAGEFLLLTVRNVRDPRSARDWLKRVLSAPGLVPSAAELGAQRRSRVATLAFSHAGLLAWGFVPSAKHPFPSVFGDGMGHPDRSRQLGDQDAASWRWADTAAPDAPGRRLAHVLVAHYWVLGAGAHAGDGAFFADVALDQAGFDVLRIPADPAYLRDRRYAVEPFGFADGLSQPVIAGLRADAERQWRDADGPARRVLEQQRVAAGEFLLGQRNEYAELAYAPDLQGWRGDQPFAFGASYLAVRQICQDVARFEAFVSAFEAGVHRQPGEATIAEKMVGRFKDGRPLCPANGTDPEDFGYYVLDAQGFGCPRGAHMRRGNPRDSLGHDAEAGAESARLHRLLRRGRAYRLDDGGEPAERGLFFMALNADIERQFAFVQQRWIAGARFAGLAGETDPLLGPAGRAFTVQDPWVGERVTALPRFTRVVGGGYFLLPGLPALRFMAGLDQDASARTTPAGSV